MINHNFKLPVSNFQKKTGNVIDASQGLFTLFYSILYFIQSVVTCDVKIHKKIKSAAENNVTLTVHVNKALVGFSTSGIGFVIL